MSAFVSCAATNALASPPLNLSMTVLMNTVASSDGAAATGAPTSHNGAATLMINTALRMMHPLRRPNRTQTGGARAGSARVAACCACPRAPSIPLSSFAQLAPALLVHLDPVLLGGALDPAPSFVTFVVGDALDLVEPRDRVAHVAGIVERLLALLREGELILIEAVALLFTEFGHGLLLSRIQRANSCGVRICNERVPALSGGGKRRRDSKRRLQGSDEAAVGCIRRRA